MQFKNFYNSLLIEKIGSAPLISIDIQPLYYQAARHIIPQFINVLEKHQGKILYYFNGPEIGGDELYQVQEMLLDEGLSEESLEKITFKEKTYAFFRSWMDEGIGRGIIIRVIRYMVMNRIWDSRDIDDNTLQQLVGEQVWEDYSDFMVNDPINIPDINLRELKEYNHCYLCGGGESECLAEFRLLMDAFNIKYTLISSLIY